MSKKGEGRREKGQRYQMCQKSQRSQKGHETFWLAAGLTIEGSCVWMRTRLN